MSLNNFFDNIYVLNLQFRKDRLNNITNRLEKHDIKFERFTATDGSVIKKIWEKLENKHFSTPNYLACAISHLSIYNDANQRGFNKILILEDDVVINKNINKLLELEIPDWKDVFYLGWIPLSDDKTWWTYSMANQFVTQNFVIAKNFWGMFAYGTTKEFRKEILEIYNNDFPMELDRFFVEHIQPQSRCLAMTPQLFACQDIWSDNGNWHQTNMLDRSVDQRFAKLDDYE